MKKESFAEYAQDGLKITQSSHIKKWVLEYYNSLYPANKEKNVLSWYFASLFQPPMSFAKIATFVVVMFWLSTWVYATVAPESFARASTSVKTSIQSTARILHITSDEQTDVDTDTEVKVNDDRNAMNHYNTGSHEDKTRNDIELNLQAGNHENDDDHRGSRWDNHTSQNSRDNGSLNLNVKGQLNGILTTNILNTGTKHDDDNHDTNGRGTTWSHHSDEENIIQLDVGATVNNVIDLTHGDSNNNTNNTNNDNSHTSNSDSNIPILPTVKIDINAWVDVKPITPVIGK